MILIVGLGNPGPEYAGNRHNIGFMIVDGFTAELEKKSEYIKANSIVVSTELQNKDIFFLKPLTYMNRSGFAIKNFILGFDGEIERILVVYDDMDIEFGEIRLRAKGSAGGHNGLESIMKALPDLGFDRMRFGIGRPPGRMDPSKYVLSDFKGIELEELEVLQKSSYGIIRDYIDHDIYFCMNKYN